MVMTAKLKKRNLWILLAVAAAVAVILLLPREKGETGLIETNEQRIAFLQSFGWEPSPSPIESGEVRIPEETDEVFERYNELQKSQGYDLTAYAGKCVERFVYEIPNCPDGCARRATLLIYQSKIIGGDISSCEAGGTMHGFAGT